VSAEDWQKWQREVLSFWREAYERFKTRTDEMLASLPDEFPATKEKEG
jgi:hypothetical protein